MKANCEKAATRNLPPVSSREAAERAVALTKEQNALWEPERSFSNGDNERTKSEGVLDLVSVDQGD